MSTITVTLVVTPTALPTGVTFDHINVTLTDFAGAATTNSIDGVSTLTTTFENAAAGDGSVTAQAIDSTGANLGTPLTQAYTGTGSATFPQPASMTIVVS